LLRRCSVVLLGNAFTAAPQVSSVGKHAGCHRFSASDASIAFKIWDGGCVAPSCVHAVIARHPFSLKGGSAEAIETWNAYYGAWAAAGSNATHRAFFFRYEDLVRHQHPCVARTAVPRFRVSHAWKFWNYSL
jgi:hypothetical protein